MMDNFALIIGAAKSGTTSLFYYLAEHPEISSCSIKEPNFFTDDEKLSKGWGWYQNLWTWDSEIHKIAMEASTSYTKIPYFPNAAERIVKMPASTLGASPATLMDRAAPCENPPVNWHRPCEDSQPHV